MIIYDTIRSIMAKLRKDGTPDKRYKENQTIVTPKIEEIDTATVQAVEKQIEHVKTDPQTLFNNLLTTNNLKIDFDVLEGTVPTQYGIIKLDKPTLVIKASYVK